ncbi:histidine kinase [Fibrella sp. HMF5335]|uniref:Histidine kinase n=1 Tax=Fibrella rubiginis TaxID=2817060 RepID=A0A939K4X8_9BACT|nr:sensor histidine kinase [Fibrella rubiginis]MBO0935860.1 histidine kinase [Fibrella rubiginis]
MRPLLPARYLALLQVIVIPFYVGVFNWILIGSPFWQNWRTFGIATGVVIVLAVCNFLINGAFVRRIRASMMASTSHIQLVARQFMITATGSSLVFGLAFFIYQWLDLPGFVPQLSRLGFGVLFTILTDAIMTMSYESVHNFNYWQQSKQEVETLSKAQLQAQLDALRQQVNPHFLFNSLNSLSALIEEDPRQAGAYADELGSVYRYLLRANETPLVTLGAELAFIDSYYHLLKTRHGEALTLVRRILPGLEERQLPPLTLQLLIENAVKHNVLLPEQPLTIDLTTDGANRLIVSNNVQRKPSRGLSNGVGLSNILSKYQMLGQPAPLIEDDGREFRVVLPLV